VKDLIKSFANHLTLTCLSHIVVVIFGFQSLFVVSNQSLITGGVFSLYYSDDSSPVCLSPLLLKRIQEEEKVALRIVCRIQCASMRLPNQRLICRPVLISNVHAGSGIESLVFDIEAKTEAYATCMVDLILTIAVPITVLKNVHDRCVKECRFSTKCV
jgi:hypothetical protein